MQLIVIFFNSCEMHPNDYPGSISATGKAESHYFYELPRG